MNLFVAVTGIVFALLSSMILAYVSMVTMIGPWIAPALVLITSLLIKFRRTRKVQSVEDQEIVLAQTVGSVGAIVAVAIGFTLPTLYFLDPKLFNAWLASPIYFCSMITASTASAGILGMYLAKLFGEKLIYKDKLKFPVSMLIHKMITSQSQGKQVKQMLTGFFSTGVFCFIRDGLFSLKGLLPRTVYLFPSLLGKHMALALFQGPTLWAVGFITGAVIATPLIVGMFSKYLVLYPINHHSEYLPFKLFAVQNTQDFIVAFCSGLVLIEAILGIRKYPKFIWDTIKSYVNIQAIKDMIARNLSSGIVEVPVERSGEGLLKKVRNNFTNIAEVTLVFASAMGFLTYLQFSLISQIVLIALTVIATYQISLMGANIGLVPFGRFATFVMIPMMLIFKLNYVQITFLCVFVNVTSAVASDLLFDYKVGELCNIKFKRIRKYQWLGLVVTSLSLGFLLWLLFTNFQLGSSELFAQRGKTRALLIMSTNFNWKVLLAGAGYGYILRCLKVSPALTLGGILMPNSISIGLVLGGLTSKLFKDTDSLFPFWSGVFASESVWILGVMLLKLAGF